MLRSCEVGAEGYRRYADTTDSTALRDRFEQYAQAQVHTVKQLSGRVTALSGEPRHGGGVDGIVARLTYRLRGLAPDDALGLLLSAHYNETAAIESAEHLLREGVHDEDTRRLLEGKSGEAKQRQRELAELIRVYRNGEDGG